MGGGLCQVWCIMSQGGLELEPFFLILQPSIQFSIHKVLHTQRHKAVFMPPIPHRCKTCSVQPNRRPPHALASSPAPAQGRPPTKGPEQDHDQGALQAKTTQTIRSRALHTGACRCVGTCLCVLLQDQVGAPCAPLKSGRSSGACLQVCKRCVSCAWALT